MKPQRYHYEIGFPEGLNFRLGMLKLDYSKHAFEEARNDRFDEISLPALLDTDKALAVELETTNEGLKVLYRVSYDDRFDLCLVVLTQRSFVKTIWLIPKNDKHRTLRRELYTVPERGRRVMK